jgi:Pregnancy-associated plasma protein-A
MATKTGQPKLTRRACGAMAAHMALLERYPAFRTRQQRLEGETARRRAIGFLAAELKLAKIKVAVHVVYKEPSQNVSDAQINSQIKVLNLDFRAKNTDRKKTPSVWNGLVADSQVEFTLYKVTRTQTTRSSFGTDDGVKRASSGGVAPLNPSRYLNIWACPLEGGLLGYAQFPGGPKSTDGVVINYRAFGTTGTAQAPFNKGRTATHEVGHYLNLRHIWGDTEDCTGSDLVADTPNCAGPNFEKPTFPKVSCNNGPNGDMFMNYMDYVDDTAMFMFTPQQVARMRTALDGPRKGLW